MKSSLQRICVLIAFMCMYVCSWAYSFSVDGIYYTITSSSTLTKYCSDANCGTVDNKTELDPEDDAAY